MVEFKTVFNPETYIITRWYCDGRRVTREEFEEQKSSFFRLQCFTSEKSRAGNIVYCCYGSNYNKPTR